MSFKDELEKIRKKVETAKEDLKKKKIDTSVEDENRPPFSVDELGINLGSISLGIEEISKSIGTIINTTIRAAMEGTSDALQEVNEVLSSFTTLKEDVKEAIGDEHLDLNLNLDLDDFSSDEFWQRVYNEVLRETGDEERARVVADKLSGLFKGRLQLLKDQLEKNKDLIEAIIEKHKAEWEAVMKENESILKDKIEELKLRFVRDHL